MIIFELKDTIALSQKWDPRTVFDLYEANIPREVLVVQDEDGIKSSIDQSNKLNDYQATDEIWPDGFPNGDVHFAVKVVSIPLTRGGAPEASVSDLTTPFDALDIRELLLD